MSVEAGVEISLEMLVGEMPEIACEVAPHDEHPASHYFLGKCDVCGYRSNLKAICTEWTQRLINGELACKNCESLGAPTFLILAPIKK